MARWKRRAPRRRSAQPFWLRDELLLLLRAWQDVQSEGGDALSSLPTSTGASATSGAATVPSALNGNHEKGSSLLLPDAQLETRIYKRFCALVLGQNNGASPTKISESDVKTQLRDLVVALEAVSASQRDRTVAADHEQPALRCDDVDPELMRIFEEIKSKEKPASVLLVSSLDAVKNSGSTSVTADAPSDSPATKEEFMLFISAWRAALPTLQFDEKAPELLLPWKQALRDTHEKLSKFQLENDDQDWFALSAKVQSLVQAIWELRERDDNMAFVDMGRDMFDELTALFEKEREFDLKQKRARSTNWAPEHTVEQRVVECETGEVNFRGNAVVDEDTQAGTSEGGINLTNKWKQSASEVTKETPAPSELMVGSTWTRSQLLTLLRAYREMSPHEAGENLVSFDDRIFKHVLSLDNSLANRTQRNMVDHKRKILQSREFIADFNNRGRYNGAGALAEKKSWFSLTQKEQMKIVKSKFSRPQFMFLDEELYDQLDAVAGANELLSNADWSDKESSLAVMLCAWHEALVIAPRRPAGAEEDSLDFLQRYRSLCAGKEIRTGSCILQKMYQLRTTYNAIMHYNKTKQADASDADWWFSLPTKKKYNEIVLNWSKWKDCVRITRDTFDTLALIFAKEQNWNQDAASVESTASVYGDSAAEIPQKRYLLSTPAISSEDTRIEHEHDDLDTRTREKSTSPSQVAGPNDEISRKTPVDHAASQADNNLEESGVESIVSRTPILDNAVEGGANGVADKDIVNKHVNATFDNFSSHIFEQEPTSFFRVPRNQYPPTQRESTPEKRIQLKVAVLPTKHTETEELGATHGDPLRQIAEEESTSFLRVSWNQHAEPTRCDTTTPEQRSLLEMISHLDHQATQLGVLIQQLQEEKTAAREERRRERRERKRQREQQRKLESARRRKERFLENEKDQKLLKEFFGKK